MSISERMEAVPHNIKILLSCGVFVLAAVITYSFFEDGRALDKRIASKQKDLGQILQLRDYYEVKKRAAEKNVVVGKQDQPTLSLAMMEEMVGRTFVGGHLTQLQPVTMTEGKTNRGTAIDVKVAGAPLGEVIAFVRAVEEANLQIGRMRLSLPTANPSTLDVQVTVIERRSHG
jgi:hypothetical protein